jgi:hypothetical protein
MSRSQFMVRVWIWKICVRDSRSGSPNSTFLSRRPGRSSAGSSVSGLLVAMSTCTIAILVFDNTFNPPRLNLASLEDKLHGKMHLTKSLQLRMLSS